MAGETEVVDEVAAAAHRFGQHWADPDPLSAVTSASELARAVDDALRAAVRRARAAGRTWQTIGDLLGTSRQAAFQRFGRPIDPRTGEPMTTQALTPGAAEHAVALLVDFMEGRYEQVRQDFDDTMNTQVNLAKLASTSAQVAGMVGAYEGMGEPFARAQGELTVVDVPLRFEAGDMVGRVVYRTDGKVAGLFVLKPEFA
jgi:hypothetical protein